jgi:protein-disulfide isomerase
VTRWLLPLVAVAGGLVGAGAMAMLDRDGGTDVRAYLLANPEVIPEAMEKLQAREAGKSVVANRSAIQTPFPGAVAGNPQGDVTLVEFYDYNCGYCRASNPVLRRLIARDPKLRVVFRELPILAPSSRTAARASLVAAAQGRFNAFHDALYRAGRVTDASIAASARTAGVDLSRLPALAPRIDAELTRTFDTANRLGISGVPGWVIGDRVLSGALSADDLTRAIAEARRG